MQQALHDLRPIKQARLKDGRLFGHGYALAADESVVDGMIEFEFSPPDHQAMSFVFGFQGVGQHYRCDFHPATRLVILHWFRDGIPVYLQHASIQVASGQRIVISWSLNAIRIFKDDVCFINVLASGITGGHWGFATTGDEALLLPAVQMRRMPTPTYRWVVLGDGYSNNRWKNRHFFSWPELAFGHRGDYLNACVAAGNTRRVLEAIDQIRTAVAEAEVIVAAGADDFIEGTPADDSLDQINQILARLKELGANRIHLCAIPPRARRDDEVILRNAALKALAMSEASGFIDFHELLRTRKEELLVNGDYPGTKAQMLLAQGVLFHVGLSGDLAPLASVERHPKLRGVAARVAKRLLSKLEAALDHLPSAGIS